MIRERTYTFSSLSPCLRRFLLSRATDLFWAHRPITYLAARLRYIEPSARLLLLSPVLTSFIPTLSSHTHVLLSRKSIYKQPERRPVMTAEERSVNPGLLSLVPPPHHLRALPHSRASHGTTGRDSSTIETQPTGGISIDEPSHFVTARSHLPFYPADFK